VSCAKTAEPIEMRLGTLWGQTHVGPRNCVSDGGSFSAAVDDKTAMRPLAKLLWMNTCCYYYICFVHHNGTKMT